MRHPVALSNFAPSWLLWEGMLKVLRFMLQLLRKWIVVLLLKLSAFTEVNTETSTEYIVCQLALFRSNQFLDKKHVWRDHDF